MPISSTVARPSDHCVCTCRSPRRSAELHQLRRRLLERAVADLRWRHRETQSFAYRLASSAAVGSGPSASRCAAGPVARTSAVPSASGGATTSSIGMPSAVMPRLGVEQRDDLGQGGEALRARPSGSADATTTARRVGSSTQRRASPAGCPPSAAAIAPVSARARGSRIPRRGARGCSCASAATICASRFGPMPGHLAQTARREPPAAAPPAVEISERRADLDHRARRRTRAAGRARRARAASSGAARPAPRSRPSRRARAASPRCRARCRAARAPGPAGRATPPARVPRGSAPPRAGTHARCRGWRPASSSNAAISSSRPAISALSIVGPPSMGEL